MFLIHNAVHALEIKAQLNKTARKGQDILIQSTPIFILIIAYLYKRGKSDAKERMEGFVIGGILIATAFGWASFFK